MGLPTVLVTRQGFSGVVTRAFAGAGLPAEASQVIYPHDMFVPGSDLSPIEKKMDELIAGLTQWEPTPVENRLVRPPKLNIEGGDYETAVSNVNRIFLRNMWSDGLPINPPTAKKTRWLLTGTDRPPEEVVIKIMPRGGITTVETIAVSLAMAGGRPEYMPVLIAALEAMGKTQFRHELMNATTCSVYPVVIVSGPVARQVRLGSGYGCLGPDPLHPAGASIGRAIRFLLQNVGGALPGSGTMSIYGGPARYTNIVFAEDEKNLPPDWESLSVEQGFRRGSNIVSAYAVSSTTNVPGGEVGNNDSAYASLNRAAGVMGVANGNYWVYPYNPEGAAGILLMAGGTALGLSKMGWSKEKIREYLWQNSKVPAYRIGPHISAWWIPNKHILQDPMPISMEPKGIKIVVAGGAQSGHMMWLQVGCCPESVTSAPIILPAHWNELLKKAEEDLGPVPYEEGDTLKLF
jgi:hypothetical protein